MSQSNTLARLRVLVATRNQHKVEEIAQILGEGIDLMTLREFPQAPEPVENAPTFEGNASIKALSLARWLAGNPVPLHSNIPAGRFYVLADDSGLEVDALNGAPGIHSARFAADGQKAANAADSSNNEKLIRLLKLQPNPPFTARFRCVLALLPLSQTEISAGFLSSAASQMKFFTGVCEGRIRTEAAGRAGFGYDPLFVPAGCEQSFAELGAERKNEISHRARALRQLAQFLRAASG